jgi:predicted ester cyclase
MSEANKAIVNRFILGFQCDRDEAAAYETLAADFVDRTPSSPGQTDRQSLIDEQRRWFVAFPDFRVDVVQQFADGDNIVTHKTLTGTHLGDFEGAAATGNAVRFDCIEIVTVRDAKIVERWMFWDRWEPLAQIGAIGSME